MLHALTRRGARRRLSGAALLTGLAVSLTLVPAAAPESIAATPVRSKVYLGAAGDVQTLRDRTGLPIAAHDYGFFEEKQIPSSRMITVRFRNNMPWKQTAALKSSSTDYQNVVRWADTLKNRGEVLVAFHHEPESSNNTSFGTPEEYKAAYRKIVDIFRSRGANNVVFTWQMTAWAFRAKEGTRQAAAQWYPGNSYIDVVGADPYNWYTCGHGKGKWNSLKTLADPVVAFAKERGKQVALPEFGSVRDSRRPAWIRDAGDYLAANDDVFVAAFYFNRAPTNSYNSDCTWKLSTSGDYSAFRDVAQKSVFKY